jgi:hypothetical protein
MNLLFLANLFITNHGLKVDEMNTDTKVTQDLQLSFDAEGDREERGSSFNGIGFFPCLFYDIRVM